MTLRLSRHHSRSNGDALTGRRCFKLPVEGGEFPVATLCGLQIRRVVAAKVVAAGKRGNRAIALLPSVESGSKRMSSK